MVIPARDSAATIAGIVRAVLDQSTDSLPVEVVVVDDGSTDGTAAAAAKAGARVVRTPPAGKGNPAAARNLGIRASQGDPVVFLDADCTPGHRWLTTLLEAHDRGEAVVGGSLGMPPGLVASARCDYYCSAYHVHPRRRGGSVPNHPPANLSVRRAALLGSQAFCEVQPIAYAHEELAWQGDLRRSGIRILFEPRAVVYHRNRPGVLHLLRRNYRWGYSAIEAKATSGAARLPWLYRFPLALILLSIPIGFAQSAYILGLWVRAGVLEPLWMTPAVLAARLAYAAGMAVGAIRWLASSRLQTEPSGASPE